MSTDSSTADSGSLFSFCWLRIIGSNRVGQSPPLSGEMRRGGRTRNRNWCAANEFRWWSVRHLQTSLILIMTRQSRKYSLQMHCSVDSGLIVVVFIVGCLLWVVGLLLFYEFEDVCDKFKFGANDSNMVRVNIKCPDLTFLQLRLSTKYQSTFHWGRPCQTDRNSLSKLEPEFSAIPRTRFCWKHPSSQGAKVTISSITGIRTKTNSMYNFPSCVEITPRNEMELL